MSAMKIIDAVHAEGGKIESFTSYCGGLPCPDDNNNPFGYKFSWSPRGVLLAAIRVAKFVEDGDNKTLDGTPGKMIYDKFFEDSSVPDVGTPLETQWPAAFEVGNY
jgi:saccharopine dehydrogenase-like NADP-dependent oxidoreductase